MSSTLSAEKSTNRREKRESPAYATPKSTLPSKCDATRKIPRLEAASTVDLTEDDDQGIINRRTRASPRLAMLSLNPSSSTTRCQTVVEDTHNNR